MLRSSNKLSNATSLWRTHSDSEPLPWSKHPRTDGAAKRLRFAKKPTASVALLKSLMRSGLYGPR